MVWRIELTETAAKQLSKIGKVDAKRITTFLRERIGDDPRASREALTGPLGGLWRYRVGDYRVICELPGRCHARACRKNWQSPRGLSLTFRR